MNERIKDLLARPGLERLNDWVSIGPVQRAALEEFAELIVQECANIVRNSSLPDSYSEACLEDIADELEELFGVKE